MHVRRIWIFSLILLLSAAVPLWATTCTGAGYFLSSLTVPNDSNLIGNGPYGEVCVQLNDPTTATITFTSFANYVFGDGSSAGVNINAAAFTEKFVSESLSGNDVSAYFKQFDSGNVSTFGGFNLLLDNHNFGQAGPADTIIFQVFNGSGTWGAVTDVLANNGSGYDAVAHVRWSQNTNGQTGYAAELSSPAVPEPSSLMLLGSGLFGLAGLLRRKLR